MVCRAYITRQSPFVLSSEVSFGRARRWNVKKRLTQRAPDWWESARFQAVCVASNWFRQNGVISSRPPAGNANR